MLYGRWTISYFDPAKKDAMLSHLIPQLDAITKEVSGAVQARIVQVADNRMVVHGIYENKAAADAASGRAMVVRDSMADFVTESPIVRVGDLVWGVDPEGQAPGSPTPTANYMTFRATDIDSSKYEALMAYMDSTKKQFRGISGLLRLRIARISENRIVSATIYDSKASSEAAQKNASDVIAGASEFFTGNMVLLQGELVWSSQRDS